MKKSLLSLALLASMTFTLPSYAGGETSGGGDAVYVEDQLVVRDFMEGSSFETVLKNEKFLKSIPDFHELILEISKVNGEFARRVVLDLMQATLFQSKIALPLLPASTTALSGPKADVQLAIRMSSEIILHPDFLKVKYASYVMIHEALHSLLAENEGPMHHHRVRNIVKYLKDYRGRYNKESLNILLQKNKYQGNNLTGVAALGRHTFKNDIDLNVRCYLTQNSEEMNRYLGINCEQDAQNSMESYLRSHVFSGSSEDGSIIYKFENMQGSYVPFFDVQIVPLNLEQTSIFDQQKKKMQMSACYNNGLSLKKLQQKNQKAQQDQILFSEFTNALNSQSINAIEKEVIEAYLFGEDLKVAAAFLTDGFTRIPNQLAVAEANQQKCLLKFPNELK